MQLSKTGVSGGKDAFGKYSWNCADCGTRSTESYDDREAAREALKLHRRTHRKKAQEEDTPVATKKATTPKAPKAAKPKSEKKAKTPRAQKGVTAEQAKTVLSKLEAGTTTLIAESKALGFSHNGPLRAALRELLGAEKYGTLMQGRRGRGAAPATRAAKKAAKKTAAKKAAPKPKAKKAEAAAPTPPAEAES